MYLILPNSVLVKLNALIFKFLWSGFYKPTGRCHYKVGWEDCCKPEVEGGLGIKNIFELNFASTMFQLQSNSQSIWVLWFHNCLFKGTALWSAKLPYKHSWAVRRIFNCREIVARFIRYHIGRNSCFLFWHDPWVRNKPLIHQVHPSVFSSAESTSFVKANVYLQDGVWDLPSSNHADMIAVRILVTSVQIHNVDHLTWDGMNASNISISTLLCQQFGTRFAALLQLYLGLKWFGILSRYQNALFIKNRLLTKDCMNSFGMQVDSRCVPCNNGTETVQHIFLECPYFDLVRRASLVRCSSSWSDLCTGHPFASSRLLLWLGGKLAIYFLLWLWLWLWLWLCMKYGRRGILEFIIQGRGILLWLPSRTLNELLKKSCFHAVCSTVGLLRTHI